MSDTGWLRSSTFAAGITGSFVLVEGKVLLRLMASALSPRQGFPSAYWTCHQIIAEKKWSELFDALTKQQRLVSTLASSHHER